ncbi:hypothetical protein MUA90_13410 [Staphylococcus sp. IVB6181]|uniref:hypothetical protein n=1 Tax=Staphylococcus sp. IVB6181 TaxID=2929481 RepID=UPI0021D2BDC6|nr:hypothetical protein [Staphylococcus sp. IVB6181]UXV34958.1 hypothetical protein MUA90_13410 [Staphylococcus sp. IVB6181]
MKEQVRILRNVTIVVLIAVILSGCTNKENIKSDTQNKEVVTPNKKNNNIKKNEEENITNEDKLQDVKQEGLNTSENTSSQESVIQNESSVEKEEIISPEKTQNKNIRENKNNIYKGTEQTKESSKVEDTENVYLDLPESSVTDEELAAYGIKREVRYKTFKVYGDEQSQQELRQKIDNINRESMKQQDEMFRQYTENINPQQ